MALFCLILLSTACGQLREVAEVGKPAPNFTLVDTKGKTWNLSELKGQVVFVNFWATWCPPCREEMPSMEALYTSMPADKFKMLAILSNDEPAIADKFAAQIGFTFPILIDPENKASQAYGLTGVPESYIIDKHGILREKVIGPAQWDSYSSRQMLARYINQ